MDTGGSKLRIVRAIIQRELLSRYTGDRVGYLWSLLIPLMWVVLIWLFFRLFNRPLPIDTDVGSFIITGLVPYISFRYTLSAVMRSKLTYASLFIMPSVNAEIVCFSVALLEIANAFVIYGVLALGNLMLFGEAAFENGLYIAGGLVLASVLGSSFAYAFVSFVPNVRFGLRAMQIVVRPLFYTSGVFFIASELPLVVQDWLWWNPILHAVEITRTGAFGDFGSRVTQPLMPLAFIAIFLVAGHFASREGGIFDIGDEREEAFP